ncbi:MAG: GNAT family N-acetyltransferase [Acidobacteria bacterium]|nr:MAG: GNAT family N-acetyltransferase [Acidobacteriota bacterium]
MIFLERITPQNVLMFKAVRLRALQDAPSAFGSTYARESQCSDAEWLERAEKWSGERGIGYLAVERGEACGIAGSFLSQHDPTCAHLISMWTAPTHRRQGVGRLLVGAILDWARQRGARTLRLMVTSNNEPAISFYQRLGFTLTGRTEPYPNDPALIEYEMSRSIPSILRRRSQSPE